MLSFVFKTSPIALILITEPDSESVASHPTGEPLDSDLSLSDLKSSDVSSCIVSKYKHGCIAVPLKNRSASKNYKRIIS